MKRPVSSSAHGRGARTAKQAGYTLIEILVATLLTLIMMGAVVTIFGMIGESISDSRSLLETTDRLRAAQNTLKRDLDRVTVEMVPPRRPDSAEGYFEYVEGPIGPVIPPWLFARNTDTGEPDSTVGDIDDLVMFTVHSPDEPFVGRVRYKRPPKSSETEDGNDAVGPYKWQYEVIESPDAEVAWFIRGRTLYRRVLLVVPGFDFDRRVAGIQGATDRDGFYAYNDLSVHREGDPTDPTTQYLVTNSLSDLTKPECRFGHRPAAFPCHPHNIEPWGRVVFSGSPPSWYSGLKLPTLCECSSLNWRAGDPLPAPPLTNARRVFDAWSNDPYTFPELDLTTGAHSAYYDPSNVPPTQRIGEDVILTNVIGFDVKAWDPGAPVVEDDVSKAALLPGDPGYVGELKEGSTAEYPAPCRSPARRPLSYGAYADLNYMCLLGPKGLRNPNPPPPFLAAPPPGPSYQEPNYEPFPGAPEPHFAGAGHVRSGIRGTVPYDKDFGDPADWPPPASRRASVYDTWSLHFEHDGVDQGNDGNVDLGTNGFDDQVPGFDDDGDGIVDEDDDGDGAVDEPPNGVVDDETEMETSPPYPVPLRGIQVKLRVFEPDSRQIREVTVKWDFVPR